MNPLIIINLIPALWLTSMLFDDDFKSYRPYNAILAAINWYYVIMFVTGQI